MLCALAFAFEKHDILDMNNEHASGRPATMSNANASGEPATMKAENVSGEPATNTAKC